MARFTTLLALCFAAFSTTLTVTVTAKPIVIRDPPFSLPLARHLNITGLLSILHRDQARAKVLKARSQAQAQAQGAKRALATAFATDEGTSYTTDVGVGTPPTFYKLVVDTGSANTWIGADRDKTYRPTDTSVDTGNTVSVSYGSGFFSGEEYTDTVQVGDLVIQTQGIGVASTAQGFSGVDGILGVGPVDLTEGTVSGVETVPTVLNNAYSQHLIDAEELGISFNTTNFEGEVNGELTFGGVNSLRYTGQLSYVPITSTSPASEYVGIDQSITYGNLKTTILSSTAGITDTGTTLILLATDAYNAYQKATGGVLDESTGLLKITPAQYASLQSLFFHIGGVDYEFTPNAQIWPRILNTAIGGDANSIYLIVSDLGAPSGQGLEFISGMTFLQRFYHVYDVAQSRVGFATTPSTKAETN